MTMTHFDIYATSLSALPLFVKIPAFSVLAVITVIGVHVLNQLLPRKNTSLPPVVFHWIPFVGNAISFGADPVKFLQNCQNKHGDVFTWILLGKKITVCLGPDGNNFVFNGNIKNVSAAEAYRHLTTPVFGRNVVYDAPVPVFMEQKRFVKTGLTTENFRLYVPMIVEDVLKYSKRFPRTNGRLDIATSMAEMIIITASRCLMGQEISAALNDKETAILYHHLDQGFSPINFMIPNLPIEVNRKRDAAQAKLAALFANLVKERRDTGKTSNHDVVQTLMQQTYKDGTPLPDHHIANLMIALLFGGQHTSASTSTWIIMHLAQDPQLVKALRQEQQEVLGSLSEPLTLDNLKNMPLLDNIIRESLRLHPPTFQMLRKVINPLPYEKSGYIIPVGHLICAAPIVSHLDEKYFKDAMRFDPYRWMRKEDGSAQLEDEAGTETIDYGFGAVSMSAQSAYLPFGAGRHRCIGEQFAYVQIKTILATFVRLFDFELPDGVAFPKSDFTSMVVHAENPCEIKYNWRK